jgi:hypothetical protein
MTQEQIDTLFQMTIMIHENSWFGSTVGRRDRDEVQEFVAMHLSVCLDIHTIPCGASWGVIVDKDEFNDYWNKNGKIKDNGENN